MFATAFDQALGCVHVLTGPDHLSALATLAANVGNSFASFGLGIRWGVGHSSGLLVVGILLILLSKKGQDTVDMPDYASHVFESIVGVFMLLLGMYGVRRAWLKRPKAYSAIGESSPRKNNNGENGSPGIRRYNNGDDYLFTIPSSSEHSEDDSNNSDSQKADDHLEIYFDGDEKPTSIKSLPDSQNHDPVEDVIIVVPSDEADMEEEEAVVVEQAYGSLVSPSLCRRFLDDVTRKISTKTMAFLVGIVHGFAGPGGVLGVIPAVQLQNWKLATLYLGCFCTSSTLTMGCYACMYGTCSSRLVGNGTDTLREFRIECFSACLSILVGITWLILLALGKLEDVFP
jgi:uncharacterized membrane protein YfcA